jgi:hypothetical protein
MRLNTTFDYIIDKNNCAPCKLKKNNNKKKDKTKHTIKYTIDDNENKKETKKFKSCYSKESLIKIAKEWNKKHKNQNQIIFTNKSNKDIWDQIQKKLSSICDNDEYCWKKQDFIKKLKDTDIDLYTFKPKYPKEWLKNKYTWLNTYDIYFVMKQYEQLYDDFIFLGPIPSDCPTKINCELSKLDLMKLKKQKIYKIGIIYNLDLSYQPGSHWIAVYIDNLNNEINIYDSQVGTGTNLIRKFIEKNVNNYRSNNIEPLVIYNDKRHQYGGSECGMYSMNFILERVHGKSMYEISKMKIPDEKMNYLRQLLYYNDKNEVNNNK